MKHSSDIWISRTSRSRFKSFHHVPDKECGLAKHEASALTAIYINGYIIKGTYMFLTCSGPLSHDLWTVPWSSTHFQQEIMRK